MYQQFDESNFHRFCDWLTKKDKDLSNIIRQHGYPPMWTRPNSLVTVPEKPDEEETEWKRPDSDKKDRNH